MLVFLLRFFYFDFIFFFLFFIFHKSCWVGTFFFYFNWVSFLFGFISFFIFYLIFLVEKNYSIVVLSYILVLVSLVFFFSKDLFFFYIFFELSRFPILFLILVFGYQIEKINSSYYLIFYTFFCSFRYLIIFFNIDLMINKFLFDFFLSWEFFFLFSVVFLIKFPIYFLHY